MKYLRAIAVTLALASSCGAASSMSLREFRGLEKQKSGGLNFANYYLVGVMEGILQAHDTAVRNGAAPHICRDGRRLEPSSARALFDTELRRNRDLYEADMPVPLVMENALSGVYACSN